MFLTRPNNSVLKLKKSGGKPFLAMAEIFFSLLTEPATTSATSLCGWKFREGMGRKYSRESTSCLAA